MIYKKLSIILRIVLTKIIWQVISLAGSIFSGQRNLQRMRNKLSNGLLSPQTMAMNMHRLCWTTYRNENVLLANTILSLFVNLSRCIEDDYAQKYKSFKQTADCRLRRMIRQKKLSLGIKDEQAQNYE